VNASDFTPKSFWEKREGKAGIGFLALGFAAVGTVALFAWSSILPFLINIVDNTLHLALTGGILAAIIYLVVNPRWRNVGIAMFHSACRFVTGVFVAVDPIGIMREHIEKAKRTLQDVSRQIDRLRGSIQEIQNMVEKNIAEINQNIRLVQTAKKQTPGRFDKEAKLAANDVGRLQDSNKSLAELLTKLKFMYDRLVRIEDAADYLVRDSERDIEVKIKRLQAIRRGHSAILSAMKLIKPDQDELYLFNLANEQTEHEIAMKVGEIERAMEVSSKFLDGMDLKNMQFEEEGWNLIDKWSQEDSVLLGDSKIRLTTTGAPNSKVFVSVDGKAQPAQQEQVPAQQTEFKKYL